MPPARKPSVNEILKKYGAKIEGQMNTSSSGMPSAQEYSQSYSKFKGEISREYTGYEKLCHSLGKFIKAKPSKKDEMTLRKSIDAAHLDIEPWHASSLAISSFLMVFFLGFIISVGVAMVKGGIGEFPLLFFFLIVMLSMFLFAFLGKFPERLANKWRLKASSQMVPAILYIVVYMRHTPNLEKAIQFASQHLQYPLSLDFRKIFYNVEIGKFSTIKESLDNYLESWRGYSNEFIESFHLIESSLFEPEEARRIGILEKSLQVVLDGVYGKMLKFTHSVRSPLTNVYMLGVVLPTLGLALIPLASAMIGGAITFVHIFVIFNLIIPFLVFYMTDQVLSMRPGGHGESTLLEQNPLYPKYKSRAPYRKAFFVVLPLLILSLLPLIFQFTPVPGLLGLQKDVTFGQIGLGFFGAEELFFGFEETSTGVKGPFGLGSLLLGLLFPLSIAMFFRMAYREKTKELIKEREKTKNLEKEFNNSLFQLGNRLGNGVPPELVFGRVAESSKGLMTGNFFSKVNYNVRRMGMSIEGAIFDKQRGALRLFPSDLIATSMRVLIESSKKGLKIAAVSLMSISEYVKNINKVSMRLKDLLAEILSDMKSNMTFLAPLLSGIVVGLAAMITSILGKLDITGLDGGEGLGSLGNIATIFNHLDMIPPYFLQISVGIYLIQIIFILTSTLVSVDAGEDRLQRTHKIAIHLKKGMTIYFIVALFAILVLSLLSNSVLGGLI